MRATYGYEIKQYDWKKKFLKSCLPKGFKFHVKPYFHQIVSVVFSLQFDGISFFHQMGAGKTKCAIDSIRAKGIKDGILVLTIGAALENWKEEIEDNAGNEYTICVLDEGTVNQKDLELQRDEYDVYIINYEALFKRFRKGHKPKTRSVTKYILDGLKRNWNALIVDEGRMVCNRTAMRTKVTMMLATYSYERYVLSGLPIANKLDEIFTQQLVNDLGEQFGISYTQFRDEYFYKKSGFWKDEWLPYEDSEREIHRCMYKQGIRYSKDECLDLPGETFENRYVKLHGDQRKFYNDLKERKEQIKISRKKYVSLNAVVARFMQITGGYLKMKDSEDIHFKRNAKLDELLYLLDGELQNEKVTIVSNWIVEQKQIYKVLKKRGKGVLRIVGGMKPKESHRALKKFRKRDDIQCLLVSPRVGGRAINITMCHYNIFYSICHDFEIYDQMRERFNRPGQTHKTTHIRLIAEDTVDESVWQSLAEKKKNLFDKVVEGGSLKNIL